jgi:four helix bundle protein
LELLSHTYGMQDYRRLKVSPRARKHAVAIRTCTQRFPRNGYSDLKKQITTAAESILFNIVEGCGARTQKEFARFLDISIKSAFELEGQLDLAMEYGIIPQGNSTLLCNETVEIRKMLCVLRKRVIESEDY